MERAQQLRIFWSYKWWLLAFAITAAVVTYFVSNSRDPVYSASALAQIVSSRQAAGEQLSEDELLSLTNVYVEPDHRGRGRVCCSHPCRSGRGNRAR